MGFCAPLCYPPASRRLRTASAVPPGTAARDWSACPLLGMSSGHHVQRTTAAKARPRLWPSDVLEWDSEQRPFPAAESCRFSVSVAAPVGPGPAGALSGHCRFCVGHGSVLAAPVTFRPRDPGQATPPEAARTAAPNGKQPSAHELPRRRHWGACKLIATLRSMGPAALGLRLGEPGPACCGA